MFQIFTALLKLNFLGGKRILLLGYGKDSKVVRSRRAVIVRVFSYTELSEQPL